MENPPKRTKRDVFTQMIKEIGGEHGGELLKRFERELLPALQFSAAADEVLTEEQFQEHLRQMRSELPAMREWLLSNYGSGNDPRKN